MSHELTDEKIAELWDTERDGQMYWDDMASVPKDFYSTFARAAYDLGKQDATEDDGFIPCTFEDIREGDTVEGTWRHEDGMTVATTGIAYSRGAGTWFIESGRFLATEDDGYTYRRRPAPITLPDPEEHPVILDSEGDAYVWEGSAYQHVVSLTVIRLREPEHFEGGWSPAKIVPEEAS